MNALWKCGEGRLIKGHNFGGEIRKTLGKFFHKLKFKSDSIHVEVLFFLYYKQIYYQCCYPILLLIDLSNIVITKWPETVHLWILFLSVSFQKAIPGSIFIFVTLHFLSLRYV